METEPTTSSTLCESTETTEPTESSADIKTIYPTTISDLFTSIELAQKNEVIKDLKLKLRDRETELRNKETELLTNRYIINNNNDRVERLTKKHSKEIEELKNEIERKDILISNLKYVSSVDPENNRMEQEKKFIEIRLRKKKEIEDWKQKIILQRDEKIKALTTTIKELKKELERKDILISDLEDAIEEKQPKMNVIIVN
jgi:hypothetical protein